MLKTVKSGIRDYANVRYIYILGVEVFRLIESRLTTRGRITIPKSIRVKLDMKTGDRIRYEIVEDGVRLVPLKPVSRLFGILKNDGEPRTLDDMNEGIIEGATKE